MEQLSLLDSQPETRPAALTTIESFFDFARTRTVWAEDDTIILDARIDRQLSASQADTAEDSTADDIASACSLSPTKSGASLFFFGRKLCELSILKSGIFRASFTAGYPLHKPDWCDEYAIRERCTNGVPFSLAVAGSIHPTDALAAFLLDAKLRLFRTLSPYTIGCCSHYADCSALGACVKPHWLESIRCYYRANLERGLNFYKRDDA